MDKILEVSCNGLTNGGVQQIIMSIVRNLSDEFIFDILVFTNKEEYFDEEFLSYGGEIFRLPHKAKVKGKEVDFYYRGMKILFGTYKILKNNGPYKAIHCHNYFESSMCLLAARMAGVKIRIVHSHNDLSAVPYSQARKALQYIYRKIINKTATQRVGCSQVAINYLFGKNIKGKVIFNAIDLERFKKENVEINRNFQPTRLNLLHVGNFSAQKNQLFLVEIAKELRNRNLDFHLTMVGGETPYYSKVLKAINEEKMEKYIEILPQNTDIPTEMYQCDLFLFPSCYEGLGIVLIEAQATGLHCFVSDAIPTEANLGNIEYVHRMEAKSWVDSIEQYMQQGIKRKAVDMSDYDIHNIVKKYKELYS